MDEKLVIEPGRKGRPRRFTDDQLLGIAREWFAPNANRSAVARANNIRPQYLGVIMQRFAAEHPELFTTEQSA